MLFSTKSLFNSIYLIFAICGCCLQLFLISSDYFQYSTVTMITISMPTQLLAPSLSICIHYGNILNYSSKKFKNDEKMDMFTFQNYFTVKEILDSTPSADKGFFESCLYRIPGSFALKGFKGDDCYKLFKIEKFFTQVRKNCNFRNFEIFQKFPKFSGLRLLSSFNEQNGQNRIFVHKLGL